MKPYSARSILLPSVMFQNAGDYECVAENKFGSSKSEITLNVKCKYVSSFPSHLKIISSFFSDKYNHQIKQNPVRTKNHYSPLLFPKKGAVLMNKTKS